MYCNNILHIYLQLTTPWMQLYCNLLQFPFSIDSFYIEHGHRQVILAYPHTVVRCSDL